MAKVSLYTAKGLRTKRAFRAKPGKSGYQYPACRPTEGREKGAFRADWAAQRESRGLRDGIVPAYMGEPEPRCFYPIFFITMAMVSSRRFLASSSMDATSAFILET